MAHLKDKVSSAIIAVGDIERARKFYSETLGLELEEDGMGGVLVYKTGSTRLLAPTRPTPWSSIAEGILWGL